MIRRYLRRVEIHFGRVFGRPSGVAPMITYAGIELDSDTEPDAEFLKGHALESAAGISDDQLRARGVVEWEEWEYVPLGDPGRN